MPTEQQLNNFWNNLQRVLTDADARIDLTSKADLARFRTITVESIDPHVDSFFEAEVSAKFTFVDDPNFDFAKATDEEFINAMNNRKPTPEKMTELYNMAREGRLFFNSLPESRIKVRQLLVDADGNPSVGPDIDHPTPDMLTCTDTPIKPPRPDDYKSAGFFTRLRAFFGNKEAKEKCREIDKSNREKKQRYEQRLANWKASKRMDKTFVRQCQNQMYACANYFEVHDDEPYYRELRILRTTLRAHVKPETDALRAVAKAATESSSKKLVALINEDPAMTPEKELLIADICFRQTVDARIERMLASDRLSAISEQICEDLTNKMAQGSPAYREQIGEIMSNPKFKSALAEIKPDDLRALAADPETAGKAVYKKCLDALVEQPRQQNAGPAQKTAQKAAVKDGAEAQPVAPKI